MKIKCIIELDHDGDFEIDDFVNGLIEFIENDEEVCHDKGAITVSTADCIHSEVFGD